MTSAGPSTPVASSESATREILIRCEGVTIRANRSSWFRRCMGGVFAASLLLNVWFFWKPFTGRAQRIPEQHLFGTAGVAERIAIINFEGTISPPFTARWLKVLERAREDDSVRGVVLAIDSPGGFVADSHQLYREIQRLASAKPVYVAMKRIAASGGYYIAMGIGESGRIYVEPTTWTGSIGVIIPRYNATELVQKIGVKSEPLVTGPLKDTLNPFRDMTERETAVWAAIMEDAFSRFVSVIADNRSDLDMAAVRELATGQIYTANQAIENHLVDKIGYVEEAVADLSQSLQLRSYDAFEYHTSSGLIDLILDTEVEPPRTVSEQILQASVPQAMYYASWNPWIP
ncbi:MAG: signal peptide peptidase SppA [Planctomycetaceae bacterium]|nr:signal peptide peptidase SppA [Planctomycetaceae bacterium]